MQLRFKGFPQAQGHIGIFRRVFYRLVYWHAVKGDLAFAGPKQRLDRNRRMAKIFFRQRVHAVHVQTRMHGVRHQHGVVDRGHRHAMAGKDLGVIFHVLADFQDRRIFQHGFQQRQGLIQRHLAGAEIVGPEQITAALLVTQRDVAGAARLNTERNANQFGAHFVKAGGFCINGHMATFANGGNPAVKGVGIAHGLVGRMVKRQVCGMKIIRTNKFRLPRSRGCVFWHWQRHLQAGRHPLCQGAKFHQVQETKQGFRLRLRHLKAFQREIERHVAIKRNQPFGNTDQLGIAHQRLAAFGLRNFPRPRQQRFQIAEFLDQQGGGLDANARRARHVINRIPGQRLHIDHAVRGYPEFLKHLIRADAFQLHRVEHFNAVADQLHQVFVG